MPEAPPIQSSLPKTALLIVHQKDSDPGLVGQKLREKGYQLDIRCPSEGHPLPRTMEQHDVAVVFGGPMSANDDTELPFIRTELNWIAIALDSEKPFLGICLGAQMLARVLGARVSPHPAGLREIGYFSIEPTMGEPTVTGQPHLQLPTQVYHWHKEGFDLPSDAELLAKGITFENQAFRYGQSAYGVQFHPEITPVLIDRWTTNAADQLTLPGAQPRQEQFQRHDNYAPDVDRWLDIFLDQWSGKV